MMTDTAHRQIRISNPGKRLFPDSGITKADLVDYYRRIAPVALPFLKDRPLTMQRFPGGIGQPGFYNKHIPGHFPDWIGRARIGKEGGDVNHVVANDADTLVYLANQGCITLHVALSRLDKIDCPDRLVFDLDPPDIDAGFDAVCWAARRVRVILETLGLPAFVKTTGSRGLHVEVPLDRSVHFEQAHAFAEAVANRLAALHPDRLTTEQRKEKRGKRLFLDYLRNAYGQTTVAPYAVRAYEGAPIAAPLHWKELGQGGLSARHYHMGNIFRRLGQMRDPWADMHKAAIGLDRAWTVLKGLGANP